MFRRFFDEGLAQVSYLIACDRTRHAAVIDPRRDIDEYVAVARDHDLSITHAIETHIHADFVSGARELNARGSVVVSGPGSALGFEHDETADGAALRIGDLELLLLHTPGHTPEHISVLLHEPGAPRRLFTGDTLFVGAVGRPDLLGDAVTRRLAHELHDSLFRRLLALEDDVQICPGHGAGSLCGSGIGSDPHSTIGRERQFNPFLQHRSQDAFVAAVLADLPETPPYFARMKRTNKEGPAVLGLSAGVDTPRPITAAAAADAMTAGAWLVDVRAAMAYGRGHAPGAVSLGFGPKLGYWAGWIIPADARVLLMADDPARAAQARRQLLRVGIDSVDAYVQGGFEAWREAGLPVGCVAQLSAAELREQPGTITIVDVRTDREWRAGHIAGALHIPVAEIEAHASAIPRRFPVATVCEGGYRSSLAASLLKRHGFASVLNVTGGMTAWRALEPTSP
jgi:hydroxyacylglutathione hydrolase